MAVMTFAAIDIGSYEVSMKIFEMSKRIGFRELNDVRYSLEIGKGVYSDGKIDSEMLNVLCEVLNDFKRLMQDFGVEEYRACGTSAFRELVNPLLIIEQIYRRTGMKIEILSSAEQHFLGYKSIAAIEKGFKKMIQKGTAILDVGGGSLQVSLFDKDALVTTQGLKMGSLRIRQRLQELEKTTIHYDKLVEEFIRNDLMSFQRLYLKDKDIRNVILMGDFITDMIFQEEMEDRIITREEFMKRYEDTVGKSVDLLAQEMEIDPEYASLVVPTMVVCRNFIDIFNAESLWAPGVSLLDGIAYDFAEKKKFLKSVHNFENDILVTSKNIAKRYSSSKSHIQGTMNLCLNIFDSMKKVHGMGARERLLLQIAALLHDCGKYISMEKVSEPEFSVICRMDKTVARQFVKLVFAKPGRKAWNIILCVITAALLLTLLPGAAGAAAAWLLFTWLFSLFIRCGGGFSTYGSLAAIIISLLWMYWCMYIILLGASVNEFIRERKQQ